MAAHARLKNEFTEDEKNHNLISWLMYMYHHRGNACANYMIKNMYNMGLELYCHNTDIWNSTQSSTASGHGFLCLTLIRIRKVLFLTCPRVQTLSRYKSCNIAIVLVYIVRNAVRSKFPEIVSELFMRSNCGNVRSDS